MNNKIPTDIIDKNGKATIVHKNPPKVTSLSARVANIPAATRSAQESALEELEPFIKKVTERAPVAEEYVREIAQFVVSFPRTAQTEEIVDEYATASDRSIKNKWAVLKVVDGLKEGYSEFVPTEGVNLLLLSSKDKSLSVIDRFLVKAAHYVAENPNGVVLNKDDVYGWRDYTLGVHLKNCKIAEITEVVEESWSEFTDTHSGNNEYNGIRAKGQCACGYLHAEFRRGELLGEALSYFGSDD